MDNNSAAKEMMNLILSLSFPLTMVYWSRKSSSFSTTVGRIWEFILVYFVTFCSYNS